MFDFVRKHTKIMQVILFLLILPSFVLFGMEGYSQSQQRGEVVATVDGRDVTKPEWDTFHTREATRIRETMRNVDPKLLDSPEARYASLDRLVNERVLAAAADKFRLTASDQRLARDLNENESIASLKKPDGSIDMTRYAQVLAQQGLSPEAFEAQVRRDLAVRQVVGGVTQAAFAPSSMVERSLGAYYERREAQTLRFASSDFSSKVALTDADVKAYYDSNLSSFQAAESAEIEYLVLDLKSVEKTTEIKTEELQAYYEQNKTRLASQEERRARHILINAAKDAPAATKAAARQKAAQLLAEVRAKPDSFGDVAKANSDDGGSKEQGGDLEFFARGAMVKPFEEAAFSLKKGDISDVVETDFGFHIIQLTDVRGAKAATFEELKPKIESDLRKQKAQSKFAELAEPFSNSVFENPDNLKTTAERFGLTLQTQAGVRRVPLPGVTSGPLANPRFLDALFSADSISKKSNTQGIDIGGNQIVSGRLVKYSPARQLTLEEVAPRAKALATQAKAAALAKAEGEKVLAQLRAGQDISGWSAAGIITRDTREAGAERQPTKVVDAVMRVDPSKLPGSVGVEVPGFGFVVAKVSKVLPREARKPEEQDGERRQLGEFLGSAEAMAYMNMLKSQFKVSIKVDKPAPAKADAAL